MLKKSFSTKLFSSGLQAIAVQVLGSAFFYLISIYLTKQSFGTISLMNAASIFLTTLLGFGLEQVVVRRIAASKISDWAAAAFFIHSSFGVLITFFLLLLMNAMFKETTENIRFLPWFFAAQGVILIGVSLKQFLNAKEKFLPYGIISVFSNLAKIAAAIWLLQKQMLSIQTVAVLLLATALFELLCLITYLLFKTTFRFKFHFKAYGKLVKESGAQYLSVIFDMSLSRMDWLLLGMMTSGAVLADYSFAYRAFELARLPIFMIAPVILPRLSRLMASNKTPGQLQQSPINAFNSVELFFAVMIPLSLNILWTPLVGMITHDKYGSSNSWQFLVLSCCIPLQFFINLLWSLCFGAKKYKAVSTITIICAITNVVLNVILIPELKGSGAAIAFFATTLLQGLLYYRLVYREVMEITIRPLLVFSFLALIVYGLVIRIPVHFSLQWLIALAFYILAAFLSGQINSRYIYHFKNFLA